MTPGPGDEYNFVVAVGENDTSHAHDQAARVDCVLLSNRIA